MSTIKSALIFGGIMASIAIYAMVKIAALLESCTI